MNNFSSKISVIAGLAIMAVTGVPAHASEKATLDARYSVSFLGVPVGQMKNSISIDGNAYSISGSAGANSVTKLISGSSTQFSSTGRIDGLRVVPSAHDLRYKSRRKKGNLKISFDSGNVTNVASQPKVKYKSDSVPVTKAHKKSVVDPVSSLLFPVSKSQIANGKAVCNRTLPIFDGKTRVNLVFKLKSTQKAKAEGFAGTTFTCSVRYQPISGIRPHKENVKFMKANRNMEVTVAQIGDSSVYGLFAFRVRTDKGTASGKATKFFAR